MNMPFDSSAHVKLMRCPMQTPGITLLAFASSMNGITMAYTSATSGSLIKRVGHHQPICRKTRSRDSVTNLIGPMRAYARALALDHDAADIFVAQAIEQSCREIDMIGSEIDIRTWLFGNLHNTFYVASRHMDGMIGNDRTLEAKPRVAGLATRQEFSAAFDSLPIAQREALFLTAGAGLSFYEAAGVCRCWVSTLERRAIAGRFRLAKTLL